MAAITWVLIHFLFLLQTCCYCIRGDDSMRGRTTKAVHFIMFGPDHTKAARLASIVAADHDATTMIGYCTISCDTLPAKVTFTIGESTYEQTYTRLLTITSTRTNMVEIIISTVVGATSCDITRRTTAHCVGWSTWYDPTLTNFVSWTRDIVEGNIHYGSILATAGLHNLDSTGVVITPPSTPTSVESPLTSSQRSSASSSTSTTSSSATTSQLPSPASSSRAPENTGAVHQSPAEAPTTGLTNSDKAGLGIGIGVVATAVLFFVIYSARRLRRKSKARQAEEPQYIPPPQAIPLSFVGSEGSVTLPGSPVQSSLPARASQLRDLSHEEMYANWFDKLKRRSPSPGELRGGARIDCQIL